MTRNTMIRLVFWASFILGLAYTADAQTTVYNNFGPNHDGWDYTYNMGWTVSGVNVPSQYGVEQAMSFTSTADGAVSDIWVAFFYVPSSPLSDTVTIKLARNPSGGPPSPTEVMEQWVITSFESWYQWTPPIHLQGNGSSLLQTGENYWLWAIGGETTWCGWCLNINPALTCPHTLRREGENWLPIANETASAFRVDVNSASPVSVTLTPVWPPIQIPSTGGSFQFDATVTNNTSSPTTLQAWIKVQQPNGNWYGPLLGPLSLTLPANQSATRRRTQLVPGSAPAGRYTYRGWVGTYPNAPLDSSSFIFTKFGTAIDGPGTSLWMNTGEEFDEIRMPLIADNPSYITSVSPNPFNPTTTITYTLPASNHVCLRVYDTAGRLVTTLVDGYREAGTHEATFDGSQMASGVYLYRLQSGEFTASGKMVMVK
jgi:hypothetical protein